VDISDDVLNVNILKGDILAPVCLILNISDVPNVIGCRSKSVKENTVCASVDQPGWVVEEFVLCWVFCMADELSVF
jgi:hypothetical protein